MNNSILHIEQCGFLTTLQDCGRAGSLQYGISKTGAMDQYSAMLANVLVGNDECDAVMEITQSPHRFLFLKDTVAAFTGGGLQPQQNKETIPLNQPVFIAKDTVVELKQQREGFRIYIAVAGGLKTDEFLYSHSTDLLIKAGGFHGRPLKKNDKVETNQQLNHTQQQLLEVLRSNAEIKLYDHSPAFKTKTIRVIAGAEWNYLEAEMQQQFLSGNYIISSQSNRMGYRLKGDLLKTNQPCEIISSPVTEGTIQLTSSGEMIVLMADAQTVGGYPRIATVCAADLSLLAQKKPGDEIQFQLIGLMEAEELYLEELNKLQQIKSVIKRLDSAS